MLLRGQMDPGEPKNDKEQVCLVRDRILGPRGLGTEWELCYDLLLKFSQVSTQPKHSYAMQIHQPQAPCDYLNVNELKVNKIKHSVSCLHYNTFQMLQSHIWSVATKLVRTDMGHFCNFTMCQQTALEDCWVTQAFLCIFILYDINSKAIYSLFTYAEVGHRV